MSARLHFGTVATGGGGGTPSGIDGSVQFSESGAFASDNANFFWDNTNKRLGIGNNAPSASLQIQGDGTNDIARFFNGDPIKTVFISNRGEIGAKSEFSGDGGFVGYNGNFGVQVFALKRNSAGGLAVQSLSNIGFSVNGTNSVSSYEMELTDTGNLIIGGSSGTARLAVKGSGTTSATNAFLVQNGAGTDMLGIYDNGRVFFGNAGVNQPYIINFDGSSTEGGNGQAMRIRQQANINGILMQYFADGLFNNTTSGNNVSHDFFATGYRGATGSGNYNALRLGYTINNVSGSTQTGTARGILVNATETLLEGMLHKLMDLQVGGSSKFEVLSTGSTAVSINSTTQGFLPPRMNTVQRNAIVTPAAGLMVYDTDDNKLYVFTTLWEQITSL
jgi:hypothetical protein